MLFVANAQLYKGDNLHICTFSHLHIRKVPKHFSLIFQLR